MLACHSPERDSICGNAATLSPRVRHDVLKKLQFDQKNYIDINIGNDQANVSIMVRAIHNPINTFSDLDFVIPDGCHHMTFWTTITLVFTKSLTPTYSDVL